MTDLLSAGLSIRQRRRAGRRFTFNEGLRGAALATPPRLPRRRPRGYAGRRLDRRGAMDHFVAIILICLNSVAPTACDETTAADVMSTEVRSELECTSGWQEVVGRSALARDVGQGAYVKTLCRRVPPSETPDQRQ
jgi:hypothetical protein